MRFISGMLLATAASGALANPAPVVAPAPAWAKPASSVVPTDRTAVPVRLLLVDRQVDLTPGTVTAYTQTVGMVQNSSGLSAGNIVLSWRPEIDDLFIHALTITRAGKVTDVLASQKFTVMRRETQLETATLDGRLTASLLIDGVQVGDVITLTASIVTHDPVLAGHVESVIGNWDLVPLDRFHARLHWTKDVPLRLQYSNGMAPLTTSSDARGKFIEYSESNIQPRVPPKLAPARFGYGRLAESSDYKSWSDVAALMAPLYVKAAAIDPKSDLAHQVELIRAAKPDPLSRAAAALDLVQSRVRYVALLMNQGGYVPIPAETTWANRSGDCKAKTALLLAILHGLDITAVPLLASVNTGDGLNERLPSLGLFDHVLVRATIGGRDYYLDGTRLDDSDLARIETPNFHWGLPLVPAAQLVRLIPAPRTQPETDFALAIDARSGVLAPAKSHAEVTFRGDTAEVVKQSLAQLSGAALDNALREYWKSVHNFIEPTAVSATYDPATGIERVTMDGTAKLRWSDSWLRVPGSSLAYTADFTRPAGPNQDAPFAVAYPDYGRAVTTIQLPAGITLWPGKVGHDVDQTLAGVAYHREAKIEGNVLRMVKTERSVLPEVDAATARAAQIRLRALDDEDVQLSKASYAGTPADLAESTKTAPDTASGYFERARLYQSQNQFKEAIADYTRAHELEPNDAWALANRGLAYGALADYAAAEADFAAAAKIDPANPVMLRGRAGLAQTKGDLPAALAAYTASLVADPNNAYALRRSANLNRQLHHLAEAQANADTLIKLNPGDAEDRLLHANLLSVRGHTELLEADGLALQQAAPHDAYAQVVAAKILGRAGKQKEAMGAIDAALAIKPAAFIYLNRADLRDENDRAGRRADLEAAIRLDPSNVDAHRQRAWSLLQDGEYAAAVNAYTVLLAKEPTDVEGLASRGAAYAKLGQASAAQRDWAAAAKIGAADGEKMNSICWNKAITGTGLESALDDCNRALKLMPGNSAFLDSRGLVNLKLGRLDQAIADYDAALLKEPTQSDSLYGRSVAWARKGDLAKAQADRAASEKISPRIADAFRYYGIDPGPTNGGVLGTARR